MRNGKIYRGIFITGTDTGVGKTLTAAAIIALLKNRGIDAGIMKPIHTGCLYQGPRRPLIPEDTLFLMQAGQISDPMERITPYRFREPVAPAVAARRAGERIDLRSVMRHFRRLQRDHDFLVVEGIGGALVPLTSRLVVADLIQKMELPALIVARTALGTLNHTLMTLEALRARKLPVIGVLLNPATKTTVPRRVLHENIRLIESLGRTTVLGVLSHQPGMTADRRDRLVDWITRGTDLSFLDRIVRPG